jgi:hypothetical protein
MLAHVHVKNIAYQHAHQDVLFVSLCISLAELLLQWATAVVAVVSC